MAAKEESAQVYPKQHKSTQLESLVGPLLSNWGSSIHPIKFDDFQLTLFDLISNASDDGIQQYFQQKSSDIYRFILTLLTASLHKTNPLRLANDSSQNLLSAPNKPIKQKDDNPLSSILISPANPLPPPPKRNNSEQIPTSSSSNNDENNAKDSPDTNKNVNIAMLDNSSLERNLSNIDELKEKDKYTEPNEKTASASNNVFNITPQNSDDIIVSNRNKNFFDDILLTDNDQDRDPSKTYESYDGDEFFANRTNTSREHTITEKFRCNPKEKAIVDEWRHLLHDVKLITPTPVTEEEETSTPPPNEDIKDVVFVASAEDIKQEQDENDIILIEAAEMIAPMTRIKGQFQLTTTSITFIPDDEQPPTSKYEVNLAMQPPPLSMAPAVNSSRAHSASQGLLKPKTNLNQSSSNASSASAHCSENDNKEDDKPNESLSRLHSMVLNNDEKQYWVTVSVCSSYQQVGGTRYRLMTAHRFWFIDELREIYYRRYQLRNCAFELFFSDDTSWLFNLYDEKKRNRIFKAIMGLSPSNLIESKEFFQNPKKAIKSSQIHYKWCRREITNFEYLMRLNTLAGRTFNDLTQYPVVPWVITEFESDTISLSDESIYRDLSKPIGALDSDRLIKFIDRYESLCEDYNLCSDEEEKNNMHCFMYGTHYSSIGIILYYLLRMQPFTTYNLSFQGGKFDAADRLFHSVMDCWRGCLDNTSDVKELIPEFYYLSDFLLNKQDLDLGKKQGNGGRVGDVVLPPWSNGNPERFVKIMREALESEYVSSHLNEWIDLIFGWKQGGTESIKSHNVFHPYTYQGNVEIDKIEDKTERIAILSQIDEFGQTPLQLFSKAHPKRLKKSEVLTTIFKAKSVKYYSKQHLTDSNDIGIVSIQWIDKNVIVIGSDCCVDIHRWEQSKLSIEKKKNTSSFSKIIKMAKSKKQNKIANNLSDKITHKNLCFATTSDGQYTFASGFEDCSFVVWDIAHCKVNQGITKHHDIVSCLALDQDQEKQKAVLVTGSYDKTVMVWRVNINYNQTQKRNKKPHHLRKQSLNNNKEIALKTLIDPNPTHILDNQLAAVLCVDISLKSGIIVCCSLDGIVNVYNSSTGEHYHMLQPYIDKILRIEKQKETEEKDENKENEIINERVGGIPSGELSIVRVSSVFGHVLCYSKQTKDIFLYSSNGELVSYSTSRDDIYYDIAFSKTGNHIVCGGDQRVIRVKELPSFKTRKKFEDPKKGIRSIFLDKDETYMFVGLSDGNVLVYSLPQKAFVKSRVHTLTELGF